MNLFLTGATGFIGSHVLRLALAEGHCVHALRRPGARPRISLATEPYWVDGSLDDPKLAEVLQGCAVLIHLAASGVVQQPDWQECFRVNVQQSLACWRMALQAGVRRLIVCGSHFEYGRSAERYDFVPPDAPLEPTGPYHASKAAASMAALGLAIAENVELAILRPFHVFGEGEPLPRLWPALRQAALNGEDFPMTAGEQVRDFVPVEQVARSFLDFASHRCLTAGQPEIHNLGTGRPLLVRDFAQFWWEKWQARGQLRIGVLPYRPQEMMRSVPWVEGMVAAR